MRDAAVVAIARYISHPEVVVDPFVAVDRWVLSERGHERLLRLLDLPWIRAIGRIVCSEEPKAQQTAAVLAAHRLLPVETRPGLGEINRSATGFLAPDQHESVAEACFANPTVSAHGWERAVDAQARIAAALDDLFLDAQHEDVAVVGHGGVGTLWYCRVAGVPIGRRWDQRGQGHYFSVDLRTGHPLHHWRRFEAGGDP
jgi:broad specificity phosphatase PhoE